MKREASPMKESSVPFHIMDSISAQPMELLPSEAEVSPRLHNIMLGFYQP